MSPKTGRPKTENPINIRTSVRLDAETDKKLTEYCIVHSITKGEAIRKGVHLLLTEKNSGSAHPTKAKQNRRSIEVPLSEIYYII